MALRRDEDVSGFQVAVDDVSIVEIEHTQGLCKERWVGGHMGYQVEWTYELFDPQTGNFPWEIGTCRVEKDARKRVRVIILRDSDHERSTPCLGIPSGGNSP
jgi:hypothetical protein